MYDRTYVLPIAGWAWGTTQYGKAPGRPLEGPYSDARVGRTTRVREGLGRPLYGKPQERLVTYVRNLCSTSTDVQNMGSTERMFRTGVL